MFKIAVVSDTSQNVRWESGPNRVFRPSHYEVTISLVEDVAEIDFEVQQLVVPKALHCKRV